MSNEEYRAQVQIRVQDLLTGNRPRDPHLSTVSTGRLILEGLIEEIKIYRLHRQEQVLEAREQGRRHQRMGGRGQHRSGERHRRHRSRDRHRDEPRRHRERSRRRGRSNERRLDRDIADPITEGQPNSDPESITTSSSEPAIPPPAPSPPYQNPTQSRHRGPDTTSHAPSLPAKVPGTSFAAHVLNTYRHIKAEHDAGVREQGMLERTVDGWRGKSVSQDEGRERPHVSDKPGKTCREDPHRTQERGRWRRRDSSEEVKPREDGVWRDRAQTPYAPRNVLPDESLLTPPAQSLSPSISEPAPTTSSPYPAAPSPPSVVRRKPAPANVLREMQRCTKVRRAGSLGGEDGSEGEGYEGTKHSREVERRERAEEEEAEEKEK